MASVLIWVVLLRTGLTWRLIDERIVAIYDGSCRSDDSCPASTDLLVMNPLYVPGIEELFVYGSRLTGSRIKRSTLQGSAPLHLISSPDIELSGAQTIGQILRYVPAVSGNATSTAISNGGDGTATVTLRGDLDYPLDSPTPLAAHSSLGLSNRAAGPFQLGCNRTVT